MNLLIKTTIIEGRLNLRNFLSMFFSLVFPILLLLLFGSINGNDPSPFYGGYGSVDVSTSGYINLIIAVGGLMTLPITLAQYRERKILKRFRASPIKPFDILMAQLLGNAMVTYLGSLLLVIVGVIVFDLHFYGNIILVILATLLIMGSIFSIGLVIAGSTRNTKAAQTLSYIIYFPMFLLSGTTIPLEIMPDTVVAISKILPMTYGVRLLRGLWLGDSLGNYMMEIGILAGVCVVFTGIAVKTFRWE